MLGSRRTRGNLNVGSSLMSEIGKKSQGSQGKTNSLYAKIMEMSTDEEWRGVGETKPTFKRLLESRNLNSWVLA